MIFLRSFFTLLLLLCWNIQPSIAQNEAYLDSLKNELTNNPPDSTKALLYFELGKRTYRQSLPEAIDYAKQGYEYGKKSDHHKGLIGNSGMLGYFYMAMGKYDSSEMYYRERLEHAQRHKKEDQVGASYANLGNILYRKKNYEEAIKHCLKGLKVYEELGNKGEQGRILNSLFIFLEEAGDLKQAETYALKSLTLKEEMKDSTGLGRGYNNLGGFYADQGRYDEAIAYTKKAEAINQAIGSKLGISMTYSNLGYTYEKLGQYQLAQKYQEKALQLSYELDDKEGISIELEHLGKNLIKQGKYTAALDYLKKALVAVKEMDYIQNEVSLLEALGDVYAKLGDHKKAYAYATKFANLQDSLNTSKNSQAISDIQTKYETEKKNQQIELLTKENEIQDLNIKNQKTFNYALIGFLILTALLAFVIWNRYQLKAKTSGLLAEKNMELEKLNATKDKLFALIAHDLKNPLSAFRSITQSLSGNLVNISKNDIEYFLEELNKSANNLYDLLQNLLNWAISQIDQLPFHPEEVALPPIVKENISLLSMNAKEKQIELVQDIQEDMIVFSDKNILRTVLRNLIGNAIKFTPENGKVSVSSSMSNGHTEIVVSDTGIGISPEDLEKLFKVEEDVSSIGEGEGKGTGLGLILCRELLEKQGGSITAKSELGKGSSFYISIPNKDNPKAITQLN